MTLFLTSMVCAHCSELVQQGTEALKYSRRFVYYHFNCGENPSGSTRSGSDHAGRVPYVARFMRILKAAIILFRKY